MALAVLGGGALPPSCRTSSRPGDARWFLGLVLVALLALLIVGGLAGSIPTPPGCG
jgi:MYXO-CTERM domain-containing protein